MVNNPGQPPLLGLPGCLALDLIRRVDSLMSKDQILSLYVHVFEGLGQFPTSHRIILKADAVPHVQPIRRIPHALHSRVKDKLESLEKLGIIRKVEKPTEWLNPLVIIEKKNSDLRLCLDPKYLNDVIQREHFLIPTADEIASRLSNKSYFTVVDMKDGYFQVRISEDSVDYCT